MTAPYTIGYCRTSTKEQDLTYQYQALERVGCDEIFKEQESGAKRDRAVLAEVLSRLRPGDTLAVWKLDRLARSLSHLLEIVEDLHKRGIGFRSLTEDFNTSTPAGKMFFQVVGAMAEFERNLIEERRLAGIEKARRAGKLFGRKPLSDPDAKGGKAGKLALAIRAVNRGATLSAAAREFGIARSTIRRHIAIDTSQTDNAIVSRQKPHLNGHAKDDSLQVAVLG